jgi:hypothetical protein
MKRPLLITFALLAVLFLTGFTLQVSRQRWEYRVISLKYDSKTESMLNGFGSLGWELVSTESTKDDETRFYFKRLKYQ